ncbi:MAG: cytochrome c1 [Gammaproteobacteria bacterium]|nr:cytochrome c1 [Gammaproteobacteria bacterium]MCP5136106.1 cytochrome c1 [Gammaproteobacteria bacterium]
MKKMTIKAFAATAMLMLAPVAGFASGGGVHLDHVKIDMGDKASLQRGFKLFANYCLSCHAASYARYNRTASDLGISEILLKENLIFTGAKVHSPMHVAMPADGAKDWFGKTPPDLSVIARSRGTDWVYTYLRSFYLDPKKATGTNNTVFKDVGMPHVLWELQGWQEAEHDEHGEVTHLKLVEPGSMQPAEYDAAVRDLVNFLAYLGEPAQLERSRLGPWVLLFLLLFSFVAYLLKKEYWKDVH